MRGFTKNYLAEYNDIDIALDTFPYNGGQTTIEALFMGVPVITLSGRRHGTRFGCSILNNIGLGELAASDEKTYVDLAVGLAQDREIIENLKKGIPNMLRKSPLLDWCGYVREVEEKYRELVKEAEL